MPNTSTVFSYFEEKASSWDKDIRHNKIIINELLSKIKINKNDTILDVGCGTGIISFTLSKLTNNKVVAIDLSKKMIDIAKSKKNSENIDFLNCNFYDYDFKMKFDKIIVFDAYPHFIDLDKFKSSLINNLKDDGIFIIMHDLGRGMLQNVHKDNEISCLSRKINDPLTESKFYKDEFNLLSGCEDENYYFLMMQKKKDFKNIRIKLKNEDVREKKTDALIIKTFFKILKNTQFDSISISNIIKQANISSSTFYLHFKSKKDIIEKYIDNIFSHILDTNLLKEKNHDYSSFNSKKDILFHLFSHISEDKDNFLLIINNGCKEHLIELLKPKLKPIIEYYVNLNIIKNSNLEHDLLINLNSDYLITYIINWLSTSLDENEACLNYLKLVN